MEIVYATGAIVGTLAITTVIGWFVAKHLDKKYGTEHKRHKKRFC